MYLSETSSTEHRTYLGQEDLRLCLGGFRRGGELSQRRGSLLALIARPVGALAGAPLETELDNMLHMVLPTWLFKWRYV